MVNNNDSTINQYIGRFRIQVPLSLKVANRSTTFRSTEITEQTWLEGVDHQKARQVSWDNRLAQIKLRKAPRGHASPLLLQQQLVAGHWAYGALYYQDEDIIDDEGNWEILVDYGTLGVWFKYRGLLEAKDAMRDWVLDIARAYHPLSPTTPPPKENVFFLEHGYIALPYLEQEEAYARFEGHPLDVKFEITTTETHEVETSGPLERLAAALATNFAPGVSVDRIRGGRRTAAGLNGEEIVLKMTNDDKRSTLRFGWEYNGKVNSGTEPEIHIEMEAKDGRLDEKLKLWDALLNSFKPVAK